MLTNNIYLNKREIIEANLYQGGKGIPYSRLQTRHRLQTNPRHYPHPYSTPHRAGELGSP